MELLPSLQNMNLFRHLDKSISEGLAPCCHWRKIPKGAMVFAAEDEANSLFFIAEGWIKLYRPAQDGAEAIFAILGTRECFDESALFQNHDQPLYHVYAEAVEDSLLIEAPRKCCLKRVKEDGRFAMGMLESLATHQNDLARHFEDVTARSAPQRIGTFLLHFCQKIKRDDQEIWAANLPYDRSLIARRLHIKPETFSRALAKLKTYGVRIEGRHIFIVDPHALHRFCDLPAHDPILLKIAS